MKSLKELNKYILRYKWRLFSGVFFITISNIFAIFPAQVIRHAFDLVKESVHLHSIYEGLAFQKEMYESITTSLLFYGGLVLLFSILKGLFMFFMRQTIIVMSRMIEYDLKNDIYAQYQKLDTSFYKKNNTGDLMNRISEDVSKVRMYIGPAIMYTFNLTVLFILVITTMISVNPKLTLYVVLPLPILSISIYYVSTIINKKSEKVQQQLSALSTFTQESFSGIRILKAYNRELDAESKFTSVCEDYKKVNLNLVKVNAVFHPMMILLIGLSTIITIYIGGQLAINGEITTGNIAEFVIYVNMLTWPVAAVGWVTSLIQRAAASQKRINEFLNATPDIINPTEDSFDIKGEVSFKNVSFTYSDSGIEALKNISFNIPKGETIAILGRTGSGKSTLASLITRQYDVTSGEISIDNKDIRTVNLNDLRSEIGYVPQEVFLFSDTIKNNIAFGQSDIDFSVIKQAASDADILENINEFKTKFDTKVGERGITLSGGQKQRISIARAIIKEPKILIFDDCLSAIDTETEERIINNLKRIMVNKTTIIISHRVSSVKHANNIIILDDGNITETGNHKELIDKKGVYYDLYNKQQIEEKDKIVH
jgi:ATP-binding cassette subfamily B multidrug efflux pump